MVFAHLKGRLLELVETHASSLTSDKSPKSQKQEASSKMFYRINHSTGSVSHMPINYVERHMFQNILNYSPMHQKTRYQRKQLAFEFCGCSIYHQYPVFPSQISGMMKIQFKMVQFLERKYRCQHLHFINIWLLKENHLILYVDKFLLMTYHVPVIVIIADDKVMNGSFSRSFILVGKQHRHAESYSEYNGVFFYN